MLDQQFVKEVDQAIATYEEVIGRPATVARKTIKKNGEVEGLPLLIANTDIQRGFNALRERGASDRTFEAVIVRFASLFEPKVVEAARFRLSNLEGA